MQKHRNSSYTALLSAGIIVHLILYGSLLLRTLASAAPDWNASSLLSFLTIVPPIFAAMAIWTKRTQWMYAALLSSLPGLYIAFAGNGYVILFLLPPLLFLVNVIVLHNIAARETS